MWGWGMKRRDPLILPAVKGDCVVNNVTRTAPLCLDINTAVPNIQVVYQEMNGHRIYLSAPSTYV